MKLSGIPDLTLTFVNPRLLDDVSFHPCVRFKRSLIKFHSFLHLLIHSTITSPIDLLIYLITYIPPIVLHFVPHLTSSVRRWENEKILSFIPPDGNFRLISYHISTNNMVVIPVYLKHQISFREGIGGRLDITVGPKQTMGKVVENVTLEIPMPKSVLNVSLVANQGRFSISALISNMTSNSVPRPQSPCFCIYLHISLQLI